MGKLWPSGHIHPVCLPSSLNFLFWVDTCAFCCHYHPALYFVNFFNLLKTVFNHLEFLATSVNYLSSYFLPLICINLDSAVFFPHHSVDGLRQYMASELLRLHCYFLFLHLQCSTIILKSLSCHVTSTFTVGLAGISSLIVPCRSNPCGLLHAAARSHIMTF